MASFMKEFQHLEIRLDDIKLATDNFDDKKVIGSGGFGKVYHGEISLTKSRGMVAIKRLDSKFGQGGSEFLKEIRMLSCYRHENLISLLGFCSEGGEMILLYEYAARGSLDCHLKNATLGWKQRIKICLDAAKGLSYLHDPKETYQRVLHCDIKSANILLDENFNAKVSDFGLSKIGPAHQHNSILVTNALGTIGYCDPLFMETYSLTKESDVYSFGVVLFEVLCGRLCYEYKDTEFKVLVRNWKQSYEEKKIDKIIFQDIRQQIGPDSLQTFIDIAYQCLQNSREQRPIMPLVVEKLKIALESQEDHDMFMNLPKEYIEIVKAAVEPLIYTSLEELKVLLSKGVFLNGGKTWFSINDKGEHCERIYIEACLNTNEVEEDSLKHPCHYNSRFPGGRYYSYKQAFKAHIRAQFLSPLITYTVTIVFKCDNRYRENFMPPRFKVDGVTKFLMVNDTENTEDGWFMAVLHEFTCQHKIVDLEIMFEKCWPAFLEVAGIEFQPFEEKLSRQIQMESDKESQYQQIVKAASQNLVYRSFEELKVLLFNGIHLNAYKTWFSINEKGEHCEMVSIVDCLIPHDPHKDYSSHYMPNDMSRFPAGWYITNKKGFKIHVRTQYLSPLVTYTVNLVFDGENIGGKQDYVGLKYKLEGETKTSTVHLANQREDGWFIAELYQFTSDGSVVDFEVSFDDNRYVTEVEGILFQPLEQVENDQVLENEKVEMQTYSDCDILQFSNNGVKWTMKKNVYSTICKWLHIRNEQEWFYLDKNGNKCHMLPARAACVVGKGQSTLKSYPELRFGKVVVITEGNTFSIVSKCRSQVISRQTTYACYLVYKLPEEQSMFEDPVRVTNKHDKHQDPWFIYLVNPPNTPVVRQKVDQNTHNHLNRRKLNAVPQQRTDGWMEVQVWEFQSISAAKMIPINLELKLPRWRYFRGLIIQCIEIRTL